MKVPPPARPSAELRYEDPDYLDGDAVERELRRTGEVCHQCRRCLPLCPAFPKLFELVDASDDEVAGVGMQGFEQVNELCYHCKLCYNHCPYTPPHEWDVDFPALMRRHQRLRQHPSQTVAQSQALAFGGRLGVIEQQRQSVIVGLQAVQRRHAPGRVVHVPSARLHFSSRRGTRMAKLQGRVFRSSCRRRIFSQAVRQAPLEPGRQNTKVPLASPPKARD